MSLGKHLTERLRLLAKHGPEAAQLQPSPDVQNAMQVVLHNETQYARLSIFDFDRYSVALCALEVGIGKQPVERDARTFLSTRAAEIIRNLSYLEEPLAVWELDGNEQIAQLRSSPPQREDEAVLYWEVTLWYGAEPGARIMRYRWDPGMVEREVVDYPATFALVARLVDSLSAALVSSE